MKCDNLLFGAAGATDVFVVIPVLWKASEPGLQDTLEGGLQFD